VCRQGLELASRHLWWSNSNFQGERTDVIIGGHAGNSILALDEDSNRQPIGYVTVDRRILDTEYQKTPYFIGGLSGQEVMHIKHSSPQ
jgi:hypothetical protein